MRFTWSPPFVDFHNLRNVVQEGKKFSLTPVFYSRPSNSLPITAQYFLGPGEEWLRWDEEHEYFHGTVPRHIASDVGAERFESYTVPLDLTARITKHFPGTMRFERIFRCALPLTVKRQPSICACNEEKAATPPIARPIGSRLTSQRDTPLVRPPLMRSPLELTDMRSSPAVSKRESQVFADKENGRLSTEVVSKLLNRKAEYGGSRSSSPIRLDSLSLARLHDGLALAHPPPNLVDVEVRTMLGMENKENAGPSTRYRSRRHNGLASGRRCTPIKNLDDEDCETLSLVDLQHSPFKLELGATHANRHGKLASRSESGEENGDSNFKTPPTRNITPPVLSTRPSMLQRRKGKQPLRNADSPTRPGRFHKAIATAPENAETCYTCAVEGREWNTVIDEADTKVCLTCQQASVNQWM